MNIDEHSWHFEGRIVPGVGPWMEDVYAADLAETRRRGIHPAADDGDAIGETPPPVPPPAGSDVRPELRDPATR